MSQLVPSLMGPVTISALLNDDYSDEKKKRKPMGTSVTIRAQALIGGALIGAQRKLVPLVCAIGDGQCGARSCWWGL